MLLFRSHCRNAIKRNPFGEARLLGFADKDASKEKVRGIRETKTRSPDDNVTDAAKEIHDEIADVLSEKTTTEETVEKIQSGAMQLDNAFLSLEKTMETEAVRQYVKQNNLTEEWNREWGFVQTERAFIHTLETHASDFVAWERGALKKSTDGKTPIQQYEAWIKQLYGNHTVDKEGQERNDRILKTLKEYLDKEENKKRIKTYGHPGEDAESTYKDIQDWESGSSHISPKAFIAIIKNYFGTPPTPDQEKIIEELNNFIARSEHEEAISSWGMDGEDRKEKKRIIQRMCEIAGVYDSTRTDTEGVLHTVEGIKSCVQQQRKIRAELDKITRLDEILLVTSSNLGNRKSAIQDIETKFRENAEKLHRDWHDTNDHGSSHTLFGNITWYSAHDVWESLKSVSEAYSKAWHNYGHHKQAALAKKVGDGLSWVPVLGETARISLKKDQESHNEKEKNEFKDYLKSNNFKYKQLFGNHPHDHESMMHVSHVSGEHNQVRAILEYAASKGWLYDLDLSAGTDKKKIYGEDLQEMLSDFDENDVNNFYDSLRSANSSGRESEIKTAHDKVKDIENIPYFMKEIEREMKDCNLWAAIGIASRAIERGLIGETIPWVMTTISRVLREHPDVRQKASVDFFDKLGALSLYHSDSTMGILKVGRKDLYKWAHQEWKTDNHHKESDEAYSKIGMALKAMYHIENEIKKQTGNQFTDEEGAFTKANLDRYVAQVLASQIVTINVKEGQGNKGEYKFNIFDTQYDYYTQRTIGQGSVSVSKEDEDYYREVTANLRADLVVMKEIFRITSTGQFANEAHAGHYIKGLISLPKDMEEKGLYEEAKNFKKITGRKLQQWYEAEVIPSADRSKAIMAAKVDGKPFLKEIFRNGFIDKIFLVDCIKREKNPNIAIEILQDIDPTNPAIKQREIKAATDAAKKKIEALQGALEEYTTSIPTPEVDEANVKMQRIRQLIKDEDVLNGEFKDLVSEINALHEGYVKKFTDIKTLIPKIEATIAALNTLQNDNIKIIPEVMQTETNRIIDEITAFIEDETAHDLVRMKEHHSSALKLQKQFQTLIKNHEREERKKEAIIRSSNQRAQDKMFELLNPNEGNRLRSEWSSQSI